MSDDFDKDALPPWQQGDPPEKKPDDDETIQWKPSSSGDPSRPSKLGFTGDLPWRKEAGGPSDAERAGDEMFNWTDDEFDAENDAENDAEAAAEADAEPADLEDAGAPPASVPSWVTEAGEPPPTLPPAPVPPPWLADDEPELPEIEASEAPIARDGELSDDFLAQAEDLPDTFETELTYEQWLEQEYRRRRGEDPDEEAPALADLSEQPEEPVLRTGELPDWYQGLEELDADDAPDWLTGDTSPSSPTQAMPSADWLSELGAPKAAAPEEPPGEFDASFFADLDAAEESSAEMGDFNPAWLTGDETPDTSAPAAPRDAPGDAGMDDFNISWLDEDTPVTAQAAIDEEDFFAAPGSSPPEDEELGLDWLSQRTAVPPPAPPRQPPLAAPAPPAAKPPPEDDPFSFDLPESTGEEPDWLQTIDEDIRPGPGARIAAPPEDDWLKGAEPEPGQRPRAPVPAPDTHDIDSFLAALDDDAPVSLPATGDIFQETGDFLSQPNLELDDLFSGSGFDLDEQEAAAKPQESLPSATPEFLEGLNASVGAVSAAALARKEKDRPLEELPERLQNLHHRGQGLATPPEMMISSDPLASVLPGIKDTLVPAPIKPGLPSIAGGVTVSEDQKGKIDILRGLVATDDSGDAAATLSAIEQTYATPLGDEDDEDGGEGLPAAKPQPAPAPVKRRTRRHIRVDRILIALLLAAAMIAPFYLRQARVGGLPPAAFAAGSRAQAAFDRVDSLRVGDLVLVAAEYSPGDGGELDPMTDALMRHVLLRGAKPVILGGNPVGLLHVGDIVAALNRDAAFLRRLGRASIIQNRDYYVVRVLTGSVVGLRAFGENTGVLLVADIRGQTTGLDIHSLRDFHLVVVIAERADDVRAYAEQIAPLVHAPLIAASSYAAAPFVEPYAASSLAGLLVGYRDAYTYGSLIGVAPPPAGGAPGQNPPIVPTLRPTIMPVSPTPPPTATEGGTAALALVDQLATLDAYGSETMTDADALTATEGGDAGAPTARPSQTPIPTRTPVPTRTPLPTRTPTNTRTPTMTRTPTPTRTPTATDTPTETLTPTPTATATETATLTPSPTEIGAPTATATEVPQIYGIIASRSTVNVRLGPGTTFNAVAIVQPRDQVQIIGRNSDGTWYNVVLTDGSGTEGWIAASLIRIPGPDELTATAAPGAFLGGSARFVDYRRPLLRLQAATETVPSMTESEEAEAADGTASVTESPSTATAVSPITGVLRPRIPASAGYRDERWYAMTAGIIVSASVIALGALANLVRGLLRRRRR